MNKKKSPHKAAHVRRLGAKYRVRHVVERIGAHQLRETESKLKHELEQQRAWMLLARESARGVKEKKQWQQSLADNKRKLDAINGMKKNRK